MRRVGVFSGTFDPVHVGHVAFWQAALRVCNLDEIVLVPEAVPRGKKEVAPLLHRKKMLELAIQGAPQLRVLSLPSRQFTVTETLPQLRQLFPEDELTLLVGSDVARTFMYRWPGLELLLADMELAIGLRQKDSKADMDTLMHDVQQLYNVPVRYACVPSPHAHAASAQVRNGVKDTDTPASVLSYIAKHQLYGAYSEL